MKAEHPTDLATLRQLWQEAFGDTAEFLDLFFATGFNPERCLTVTVGDQTAAALYWLDCQCHGRRLAYIYAVATAKVHRGKGLCHGLMADAHRFLSVKGYAGAILVPGDPSLTAFYAGMGYIPCGGIREFACTAAGDPVSLEAVSKEQFARLRSGKLPSGGVVQEGAALDFLAGQAAFYAGKDFLLAARKEGDKLFALELLGNTSAAPGILRALGVGTGRFRTPGSDPFAMYCPFTECPAPAYFAFAFD